MILQSLNNYYYRKCAQPDPREHLPDFGFEQKEIPFVLEIKPDGSVVQLEDTRRPNDKKKLMGRSYRVPLGVKRAVNVAANLLWDTLEYVTGVDTKGKPERVVEQHAAFRQRIAAMPDDALADAGVMAVRQFFEKLDVVKLQSLPAWKDACANNAIVSFRLHGDLALVCQRPEVLKAIRHLAGASDSPVGSWARLLLCSACTPPSKACGAHKPRVQILSRSTPARLSPMAKLNVRVKTPLSAKPPPLPTPRR